MTVKTVSPGVLAVEAVGDTKVRVTLTEDAIRVDGGRFVVPPVSQDLAFKGCSCRLDVSETNGSQTLHLDR